MKIDQKSNNSSFQRYEHSAKQLRKPKTLHTKLLGHRGAKGEVFENTRQGFTFLIDLAQRSNGKLIGIEFDVQLTADNQLVIFHDESLLQLFGQQSRLDQLTYAELSKRFRLPDEIMLLSDAPTLLENFQHIELEIKTHSRTNYHKLLTTLSSILNTERFLSLPITLTSFDTHLLSLMKSLPVFIQYHRGLLVEPTLVEPNLGLINPFISSITPQNQITDLDYFKNPKIKTNYSQGTPRLKEFSRRLPHFARFLGCEHLGLHFSLYNPDVINECRILNLSTSAWTVNSMEDAFNIMSLGIDHLITDYPSTLLNLYQ